MKLNSNDNLAAFSLSLIFFFFFVFPFSIYFPSFYRQSLLVFRTFTTPVILGRSKVLTSLNNQTWANVGHRVLPNGLGHGETVALSWDRILFLNDMFLVGTRFWLVVTCSMKNTLLEIYSYHSAAEIRLQLGNGDMANWCLFNAQTT